MPWAVEYLKSAGLGDVLKRVGDSKVVGALNSPKVWLPAMGAGMAASAYGANRSNKLIKEYQEKGAGWAAAGNIGMAALNGLGMVDTAKEITKSDKTRKKELGIPEAPKMAGAIRLLRQGTDALVDAIPMPQSIKAPARLSGDTVWLAGGLGTAGLATNELLSAPAKEQRKQDLYNATMARIPQAPLLETAVLGSGGTTAPELVESIVGLGAVKSATINVATARASIQRLNDLAWTGAGLATLGATSYNLSNAAEEAQRQRDVQKAALERLQSAPLLDSNALPKVADFTVVDKVDDEHFKVKLRQPKNPLLSARPFVGESVSDSLKLSFRIE